MFVLQVVMCVVGCWIVYLAVSVDDGGISTDLEQIRQDEIEGNITELLTRVDDLERRSAATPSAGAMDRVPIPSGADQEREVADLRAQISRLEGALKLLLDEEHPAFPAFNPPPDSADGIKRAIEELSHTAPEKLIKERREEKISALRERLLREFPDDPDAPRYLSRLIGDRIVAGEYDDAHALLGEMAPLVGIEEWRRNELSAGIFSQQRSFGASRQAYDLNIHSNDIPEHERASSMFFYAYTYMKEGRYAEARSHFQALIDHYGENPAPAVLNSVNGAKTQLATIEKYLNK